MYKHIYKEYKRLGTRFFHSQSLCFKDYDFLASPEPPQTCFLQIGKDGIAVLKDDVTGKLTLYNMNSHTCIDIIDTGGSGGNNDVEHRATILGGGRAAQSQHYAHDCREEAKVWDIETKRLLHRLKHSSYINTISSSNNLLLVSEDDPWINLWDLRTSTKFPPIKLRHVGPVIGANISYNSAIVAACSGSLSTLVWDLRKFGKSMAEHTPSPTDRLPYPAHNSGWYSNISITDDNLFIACSAFRRTTLLGLQHPNRTISQLASVLIPAGGRAMFIDPNSFRYMVCRGSDSLHFFDWNQKLSQAVNPRTHEIKRIMSIAMWRDRIVAVQRDQLEALYLREITPDAIGRLADPAPQIPTSHPTPVQQPEDDLPVLGLFDD